MKQLLHRFFLKLASYFGPIPEAPPITPPQLNAITFGYERAFRGPGNAFDVGAHPKPDVTRATAFEMNPE